MNRHDHWEDVYETKAPEAVSWLQREPAVSLRLLRTVGVSPDT